jgi:hypothetical protein
MMKSIFQNLLLAAVLTGGSFFSGLHAQNDAFTIQGGTLEPDSSESFPIYFRDRSGNVLTTGVENYGSFGMELTFPASLVDDVSVSLGTVLGSQTNVLFSDYNVDTGVFNYVLVAVDPAFTVDATAPGDLFGQLNISLRGGSDGDDITPVVGEFNGTDAFGSISVSNDNNTLDVSVGSITVGSGNTAPPQVLSFEANPQSVLPGESSTLSWQTSNADSVTIDQGVGSVPTSGSASVSPSAQTTYTLTATNANGSVTRQVTVSVSALPVPVINSFTATPTTIQEGGSSTLSWNVSGADSVSIDQGIGTVSSTTGSTDVSPSANVTYNLTATNSSGSVTASVSVTVVQDNLPSPVINSFDVSSNLILQGDEVSFSWNVSFADSITITTSSRTLIDTQEGNGSGVTDSPSLDTTYRLTATNGQGSVEETVSVSVAAIVRFTALPGEIQLGESTRLSWDTTFFDEVTITPDLGVVERSGSVDLRPEDDTEYLLTGRLGNRELTAVASVTVTPEPALYFPSVRANTSYYSEIIVVNLENDAIDYDFTLYRASGRSETEQSGTLGPLASATFIIENVPGGGEGWAKFNVSGLNTAQLAGVINTWSRDGEELFATTATQVPRRVVDVPHIAKNPAFQTIGAMVNVTPNLSDQFSFNTPTESFDLGQLDSDDQVRVDFRELMGGTVEDPAWGSFTSAGGQASIVGSEVFSRVDGVRQSVGVALDGQLANELIYPHLVADTESFWTGVVVINAGNEAATVSYTVFNAAGDEITGRDPEVYNPGEKRTFLADRNTQDFGQGATWLKVNSEQPLAGYMLFGTWAPGDSFSGFQSVKNLSTRLCIPYVDASTPASIANGGFTGIALVNPSEENQVVLRLVDANGNQKQQSALQTLSKNQKLVTLVRNLFTQEIEEGDKVVVQSLQPIVGFALYGQGTKTLGGVLAVPY